MTFLLKFYLSISAILCNAFSPQIDSIRGDVEKLRSPPTQLPKPRQSLPTNQRAGRGSSYMSGKREQNHSYAESTINIIGSLK